MMLLQPGFFQNELTEGLTYHEEFVSGEEGAYLLGAVDTSPWICDLKRRVQHYGYRYDYTARIARAQDYLGPLPDWITPLAKRLFTDGVFSKLPDQIIVNEYLPGQGIAPHIDCVPCFGETIASLTLSGGCIMHFDRVADQHRLEQYLEPNSLLIMTRSGRYDWKHGIAARKSDVVSGQRIVRGRRISLTFRTMVL